MSTLFDIATGLGVVWASGIAVGLGFDAARVIDQIREVNLPRRHRHNTGDNLSERLGSGEAIQIIHKGRNSNV